MCRICYSVDNRLTDIGVTGKTAAATANASVKVCIPILIRYVQYSWLFSTNSLPFIYLFSRVQSVVVTDLTVKSLYRSRAGSHLYATEYDIWTDFGLL